MGEKNGSDYNTAIQKKLIQIKEMIEFEIPGFSVLTQISESHLYAIFNGTRNITPEIVDKIANLFNITSWQITNTDLQIPETIKTLPVVKKFKIDYKGNPEYFTYTKAERKSSYFFEQLSNTSLFQEPVYVWEVKEVCQENEKDYSSKLISQKLNYLVRTKKLKSEIRKLKKKNGDLANRDVLVYYKNKKENEANEGNS